MSEAVTVPDEDMAKLAERIHLNARPVQRVAGQPLVTRASHAVITTKDKIYRIEKRRTSAV